MNLTYKTASGATIEMSLQGTNIIIRANGRPLVYHQVTKCPKLGTVIECHDLVKVTVPAEHVAEVLAITGAYTDACLAKYMDSYEGMADTCDARIAACGGGDSI